MVSKGLLGVYKKIRLPIKNGALAATYYSSSKHYENSSKTYIVKSKIWDIEMPKMFIEEYVWRNLDKWHNKTALLCAETGRSYTYHGIYKNSIALSNFLRLKLPDLKEKDNVCIILPNIPEYAIVLLGVIQAGFQVTTMNPQYTAGEMLHQLLHSETKFIFTINKLWPQVNEAIKGIKSTIQTAILKQEQSETIPSGTIDFNEMINGNYNIQFQTHRNVEDVAVIPYSSGTTGLPKGVELSHKNIISNLYQISNPSFKLVRDAEGSFQEVIPLILPIFHLYGLVIILLNGLASGSKLITIPKFTQNSFIDVLERQQPTLSYVVPSMILFLINNNRARSEHLSQLNMIISAAAPIGVTDINKLKEKSMNKSTFLQMYGLTEASPLTHSQTPYIQHGMKIGGSGLVLPNTEFLIKPTDDNKQNSLGPNEAGEVLIRGPQVMKGYYKNAKATQVMIDQDGWLSTGDIGHYDEHGHIFITDRLKELIKVNAYQVAPAELEEIIRSYPNIEDAAVIGVPHSIYGEVPKAFIVPKPKSNISALKIEEYVASKVIKYKQLKGGVVIVDNIPKTSTGKILRRELRNL